MVTYWDGSNVMSDLCRAQGVHPWSLKASACTWCIQGLAGMLTALDRVATVALWRLLSDDSLLVFRQQACFQKQGTYF